MTAKIASAKRLRRVRKGEILRIIEVCYLNGQVVLELLDLLPDCKNQRLIPNPANPDYPVAIIK